MRSILDWVSERFTRKTSRRKATGVSTVETLEGRELLSLFYNTGGHSGQGHGQVEVSHHGQGDHHDNGPLRKAPHFYEFYVGPKRADLNVVKAEAKLNPGKGLVFEGTMAGRIDKHPATSADDSFYVFGVNRGSAQAVTPFFNRTGITFDAVVIVSVTHDSGITASVRDLVTGASTNLAPNQVKIQGREVRVTFDPALLPTPTGGKLLSQYTFNLWPRSSLANPTATTAQHPSFVASFIPENGMAPIQVPRGHGH